MTPNAETLGPDLARLQRIALVVGVAATAICVVGGWFSPTQFFRSYLVGFLVWSGVALGAMVGLMIHHLVGGAWGFLVRRLLESSTRTWPLVAILAIPILVGIPWLYTWANPGAVGESAALQAKHLYLNRWFFIARTIFYFAVWGLMIHFLNRLSRAQDTDDSPEILRKLQNFSGPGLVAWGILMSFAVVDWVMSLEPEWFSTVFSALFMMGQILSSLAFVIAIIYLLASRPPLSKLAAPKYLNDLGNMMLVFVMLWAYMQLSQLIIIWSGNLTDEIPWYMHRVQGGWQIVSIILGLFYFAAPFFFLLQRKAKRRLGYLSSIAVGVIALRIVEVVWLVEPSFDTHGFQFHWMDWMAPIGLGGIWIAAYVWQLARRPLLPERDPRLPLVLERLKHARVGDVS